MTHLLSVLLAFATASTLVVVLACTADGSKKTPAAPPPNGASGGGSQCGTDADCKGDRVCDHGQCLSPR
jgi:hypothetical protein